MTVERFWVEINEPTLRQGDYLLRCLVPTFDNELSATRAEEIVTDEYDLIVVTQSCEIYSLPFDYLTAHAQQLGPLWRLKSPFLEHFSQAFARFFMRVGLPSTIPTFP